ncbi:MAG: DUF92 domain-containing protein [Gemmatimonadota bacterium]|nr:DUF92 domain-containing protein [Gemmatimonadota bacterium]
MTPWAAFVVSAILAVAGRRLRWLTTGGTVAATVVGTTILAVAGLRGFLLLAVFFLSGSALTYHRGPLPARRTAQPPVRGRTWRQVMANGGVAAAGALLLPWAPVAGWAIVTGALAAAQADTWSTEVGRLARRPPRLITSGLAVPAGTSGAISPLGTLTGMVGAGVMAGCALLLGIPRASAAAAALGGIVGFLGDSVLGATAQGSYRCDACAAHGEHPVHSCGRSTRLVRGYRWIDNDVVNLVATAIGAGVAVVGVVSWVW